MADDFNWGGLIGGLGGLIGGMGSLFGGGDSGVEQGYDIVTMPQYSFTEPRLRLVSDYLTQNIQRMAEGKFPVWWDKLSPIIKEGLMRNLQETYYGKPGERETGLIQQPFETAAIKDLGPKTAWAGARKVTSEYADKAKAIDEYMASLGVDIMSQGEGRYLTGGIQMPKGPDAAIVNRMGGVYGTQGTPWLDLMGSSMGMLGGMDWGKSSGGQPTNLQTLYGGNIYDVTTAPSWATYAPTEEVSPYYPYPSVQAPANYYQTAMQTPSQYEQESPWWQFWR